MGRPSKRAEILDKGMHVIHQRGYAAASVDSITEAAGVPKGSFFNHFGTKELFVAQALEHYFSAWEQEAAAIVAAPALDAADKMQRLLELSIRDGCASNGVAGCFIGNMSLELSHQSTDIRQLLSGLFDRWALPFQTVVEEGQRAGRFAAAGGAPMLGRFIVNLMQGAFLRAKVDESATALDEFRQTVLTMLVVQPPIKA
jgi:TetR/AcrR family transcriptional repressor of nem operon